MVLSTEEKTALPPLSHLLLGLFYWPLAVLIIFPIGAVLGFIFKFLACLQVYCMWIFHDYRAWKRFRGRTRFLDHLVIAERLKAESDATYTPKCRAALSLAYPNTPFPWRSMLGSTLSIFPMLLIYPFWGLFQGIETLFSDATDFWHRLIGVNPNTRYELLLSKHRKSTARGQEKGVQNV